MDREDHMRIILGFQEGKQEAVTIVRSSLEKIWKVRYYAEESKR